MKKNQLISIVMNCYNGERFLKQSLNSVINQDYQNWELIFFDNSSTDKSAEIFKSYLDKRFHYYYSNKRQTYQLLEIKLLLCKVNLLLFGCR